VAPSAAGYDVIKTRFNGNGIYAPSTREVQEMLGARYGLSKDTTCRLLVQLLNKQAAANGQESIEENVIKRFDCYLPQLAKYFAQVTVASGWHTPLDEIAIYAGYSTDVIESALRKLLLPEEVCRAISIAAHSVFPQQIPLIEPLAVPEADRSFQLPAVNDGRGEIINRLRSASIRAV